MSSDLTPDLAPVENPRYVVVSMMKNEGPYILEWVSHYLAMGFEHLVVATNDCEDRTNNILNRLQELGYVTRFNNHHGAGGLQRTALRKARRLKPVIEADWIFTCDADEYLNVHVGDGSVRALIDASGGDHQHAITVPWRIFGSNGVIKYSDASVTEQFTDAEPLEYDNPRLGKQPKSLISREGVDNLRRIGTHIPIFNEDFAPQARWVMAGDYPLNTPEVKENVFAVAQVNHYTVRSVDAMLIKSDRGRVNHMDDQMRLQYWRRWNRGGQFDDTISRYAPRKQAYLDMFRADPVLPRQHRQSMLWHMRKVKDLRGIPEYLRLHRAMIRDVRKKQGLSET